ncbi:MAG: PEP-CTERM sorting domain-containing protein [Verrucomicrobiales bacterium]|jgi:hypothetical protein|nr:PEP-CTERM sorting domain-containing protein [Verrucomicrobiales bacterium]
MTEKLSIIGVLKLTACPVVLAGLLSSTTLADTWTRSSLPTDTNLDWSDGTKWTNDTGTANTAPNQVGAIVVLPDGGSARNINLTSQQTLGVLNVNAASGGWTIAGSDTNNAILNFNNGAAASELNIPSNVTFSMTNVNIRLNGELIITSANTRGTTTSFAASNVTSGIGDLILKNNNPTAQGLQFLGVLNHTGWIANESTGSSEVALGGTIGSNITGIRQSSATSTMRIAKAFQDFAGQIVVQAGTLKFDSAVVNTGNITKITVGDETSPNAVLDMSAGNLTLNASTTLAGSGSINANAGTARTITASVGSHIAPGNTGAGTLIINGNVYVQTGANMDFDLGATSDFLNVTGNFRLGTSLILNINLLGDATVGQYDLVNFGSLTGASAGADVTGLFTVNGLGGLVAGTDYTISIDSTGTKLQFDLNALPIPEPSTWVMLGLGIGLSIILRLRRKNSAV